LLLLLNPRKFGRQAGRKAEKAIRSRETQEDTQPTQPKQKSFQNFALLLLHLLLLESMQQDAKSFCNHYPQLLTNFLSFFLLLTAQNFQPLILPA
jgi:hypothetical protein